jgi:exodeoxyribonuclease VII small subunit
VDNKSFGEGLKRLEKIVRELEEGDLSLEEALSLFEEGIRLTRLCNKKLEEAEGKIKLLLQAEDGTIALQTWEEGAGQ